jgi:Protein of unknown function (DUF1572)
MTGTSIQAIYLRDVARTYRTYKSLGDRALAQVADADLHTLVDPGANSIAIIIKHVAGNLRSRFTDFLTADGEKPDRNRDGEFEMAAPASREQLLAWWDAGFGTVLASIEALAPGDLDRTVYIRQEAFLVVEALNRSVTHTAYHVGQIVYLAKHFAGPAFTTLTVPKGKSADAKGGYKKNP